MSEGFGADFKEQVRAAANLVDLVDTPDRVGARNAARALSIPANRSLQTDTTFRSTAGREWWTGLRPPPSTERTESSAGVHGLRISRGGLFDGATATVKPHLVF